MVVPRGRLIFCPTYLQELSQNICLQSQPYLPSEIPCRIFIHWECYELWSKLPLCKPKARAHDTLNQWEHKDSKELGPYSFRVNMLSGSWELHARKWFWYTTTLNIPDTTSNMACMGHACPFVLKKKNWKKINVGVHFKYGTISKLDSIVLLVPSSMATR